MKKIVLYNGFTLCSNAIIMHDNRVLIGRMNNKPNAIMRGYWVFPGGKQDSGEDKIGCLFRETKEETGLDISNGCLILPVAEVICPNYIVCYYFTTLNNVDNLAMCTREFSEYKWVSYLELKDLIKNDKCSTHFSILLDEIEFYFD